MLSAIIANGEATAVHLLAAFRAFIRGGGDIGLFEATSAALREFYRQHRPQWLLDIGAGDGLALRELTEHQLIVGAAEPSSAWLSERPPLDSPAAVLPTTPDRTPRRTSPPPAPSTGT
ncbi:hypothetical protein ACWDKQ_32515 [Saccharopolyspora sp. NPDC000995]